MGQLDDLIERVRSQSETLEEPAEGLVQMKLTRSGSKLS
jgi:hypothetical protein